ncbi:MAG: hypothetical protein JNL25_10845 [Rhodospirillaceae bacterium]|nr:hypothetical protein [Rhodospirillaceae bacterium]
MPSDAAATNPLQQLVDAALAGRSRRDYPAALAATQKAFQLAPRAFLNAKLWSLLFNAPPWFETAVEHEDYLAFADTLMALVETACGAAEPRFAADLAAQFLHGAQFRHTVHNDLSLTGFMGRRAALFGYALSHSAVPRGHVFPTPVANGARPRLGIIFKHMQQDPETTSVLPFFQHAKAAGIEVILFVVEARGHQAFVDHLKTVCDKIAQLPTSVPDAVTMLRQANLDIVLFGNDITAKPSVPAYLSFYRIARRMCCCVSTLVTTASPQMDVYFGCDYYAARGCASEFTERFVSLPDPGFAFLFPSRQAPAEVMDRAALGVSPDTLLLTSGANHTKLHADLVDVWIDILRRLPQARLLLYPFPPHFGAAGMEVEQRLRAQLTNRGIAADRLILPPPLPGRDAVIAMLRHVDLGLDSFPYTGVTTIVDAIEAGLPTVSLAGRTLRTAQGGAILHSVGMDELVVETGAAYVDLAVALGEDATRREGLRARLQAVAGGTPPFFDTDRFGKAVAAAYHQLHADMAAGC